MLPDQRESQPALQIIKLQTDHPKRFEVLLMQVIRKDLLKQVEQAKLRTIQFLFKWAMLRRDFQTIQFLVGLLFDRAKEPQISLNYQRERVKLLVLRMRVLESVRLHLDWLLQLGCSLV